MNIINVSSFDELVSLINKISDEKSKRILLSKAADVYGSGGKAHIVELTGISYPTLTVGKADSENDEVISDSRIRKKGAGRKPITETCPNSNSEFGYQFAQCGGFSPMRKINRENPKENLFNNSSNSCLVKGFP